MGLDRDKCTEYMDSGGIYGDDIDDIRFTPNFLHHHVQSSELSANKVSCIYILDPIWVVWLTKEWRYKEGSDLHQRIDDSSSAHPSRRIIKQNTQAYGYHIDAVEKRANQYSQQTNQNHLFSLFVSFNIFISVISISYFFLTNAHVFLLDRNAQLIDFLCHGVCHSARIGRSTRNFWHN